MNNDIRAKVAVPIVQEQHAMDNGRYQCVICLKPHDCSCMTNNASRSAR